LTILVDSTVLIDALRNRNQGRKALKTAVLEGHVLATSAVNVGEVYAGMRAGEESRTATLLSDLECFPVTAAIGRAAGLLANSWARQGRTLKLPDMLIAATALEHGFSLMTDNRKDYPMPELRFYPSEREGSR
jgi:predicted nucleic acid-binding protein